MVEEHAATTLEVGSLLAGRYRVGELLGVGGMATVHRATDEVLRRDVALKILGGSGGDAASRRREHAEIDMLSSLSHRAPVTVFDAATVHLAGGTSTILVMELVDGPTLSRRRADGPIADADLARLALDVAEALTVVHARGIVHRDVKPSNVLLAPSPLSTREFDARLADFGIATLEGGARLTATGTVLGTAAYLSPEQALGGRVAPAADVYSLGLVLLEAITGRREFPGPALEALSARILRDPVVPDSVHPRWASLLRAMTAREPEDRPSTEQIVETVSGLAADRVPAMVDAAAATSSAATATGPALRTRTLPAAAQGTRPRRRRGALAIVGGIAASAALAAAAIAMQPRDAEPGPSQPAEVAETEPSSPSEVAPTTIEPTPTLAEPAPPPAPVASQAPAVADTVGTGPGSGTSTGTGPGSNGNGNGPGSNSGGNGNGPGSNSGGNGNGPGSNSGGNGNGSGGNG